MKIGFIIPSPGIKIKPFFYLRSEAQDLINISGLTLGPISVIKEFLFVYWVGPGDRGSISTGHSFAAQGLPIHYCSRRVMGHFGSIFPSGLFSGIGPHGGGFLEAVLAVF